VFNRVLVPLDGSSFGEAALRPAVAMVRRSGGELRLVSVQETGWTSPRRDVQADMRRWRAEYLTRVGRTFLDVPSSAVVREGTAEREILEEAESWGADVVVMSTHGRGAVSRFWLGSVADHCLRNARLPLMLVRAWPSALGLSEAVFAPRRIVVPLDGTELAERALEYGTELAQRFGAALELVRVVPELDDTPSLSTTQATTGSTEHDLIHASEYVHGVECGLRRVGLAATSKVVTGGHPAQAIIDQAAGDLVVMATHSRSLTERAEVGSVTDKVVRAARGPVLAIPVAGAMSDATGDDPPRACEPSTGAVGLARRVVG
jgi:nucleotide-binding universal stress UspA family protein